VRRANAYREAGADCLFIPGAYDGATIAALAREIAGPTNILAGPLTPSIPELERLGVARVSVGSGPHRATLGLARRIVQELLGPGTYEGFTREALPYAEVNQLLEDRGD
jgi:2-methylisocitrate lyase-like PEP mutase family enzyme